MNEQNLYRRIRRRERYGSRSTAVVTVLVIAVLSLAYVGTESVLAALGRPPLLVSPKLALDWAKSGDTLVPIVAVVALVLAVVLLGVAFIPGRRARHALPSDRLAIIVDDAVIAGALAREARLTANVSADRVQAHVSARRARVIVTPTSGMPVDADIAGRAVADTLTALDPRPRMRATTRVSEAGKVGS